jgi:hypothetical protein
MATQEYRRHRAAMQAEVLHRSRRRRPTLWPLLLTLLVYAGVIGSQTLLVALRQPTLTLDLDSQAAELLLRGFHHPEQDGRGLYRWTQGQATIDWGVRVTGSTALLGLRFGPQAPNQLGEPVVIGIGTRYTVSTTTRDHGRQLRLLVPQASSDGALTVQLSSPARVTPGDGRALGLRLEAATLDVRVAGIGAAALPLLGAQLLLLGSCGMLLHWLQVARLGRVLGTSIVALGTVGFVATQPLLATSYLLRLAVAVALLAALTPLLLPPLLRALGPTLGRAVWGIALLACALRLIGTLYPPFDAYDLQLNLGRLHSVVAGNLVLTGRALEFRNNPTVYPPGPYLVFAPGLLLGLSPKLLVQGSIAIVDGLGAATTALLAHTLGLGRRTVLLTALLYAAVPITFTTLWYGLTAQIFGQALMAPLAVALLLALRQRRWAWASALALLCVACLSHIGVATLAIAWLAAVLLLFGLQPKRRRALYRVGTLLMLGSFLAVSLIYIDVVLLKLAALHTVGEQVRAATYLPAYNLIWRGWLIAFSPLVLVLLPLGLWSIWRSLTSDSQTLIGAWLGVVVLFCVVELVSALQVRYIYFLTPLACLLAAHCLALLVKHGRAAVWVTVIVVTLLLGNSIVWWDASFNDQSPSMVSLLR